MRKSTLLIILFVICLLTPKNGVAEETKSKCYAGLEFLTGFVAGELRDKKDYQLTPFLIDFDFDLKPLLGKLNFNPRQLLQFQLEPFISLVSSPNTNIETGTSFLLKIGLLPQTSKFLPYIKGGAGIVYMTQHTLEQDTQFNFTEQLVPRHINL